jgi:ribonuclease P protein component
MARALAALPRAERLRAPGDFQRLFQRGLRTERPAFVLLWLRAPGPRAVAFAAGRRLGGSVVRNRARRRLREAYRRLRQELPTAGVRLCFVARRPALTLAFPVLVEQVAGALRKVTAMRSDEEK